MNPTLAVILNTHSHVISFPFFFFKTKILKQKSILRQNKKYFSLTLPIKSSIFVLNFIFLLKKFQSWQNYFFYEESFLKEKCDLDLPGT